jgi:DNA invertase Pin-like site-specific DNA recombinase
MLGMSGEAEVSMDRIHKEECVTIDDAALDLKISRTTLYNYLNFLGIQRHKFPFDRRTYILKPDLERIREFMKASR